jgi:hypothetical protein
LDQLRCVVAGRSVFGRPARYEDVNDAERLRRNAVRAMSGAMAPTLNARSASSGASGRANRNDPLELLSESG